MAVLPNNPNQQMNPGDPGQANNPNQLAGNDQFAGKKQQGTGFTNLNRILQANQKSNIGQAFGNKLGQNIQGQQQQFGQAQNQFGQQTEQQRLDTGANKQLREQQIGSLAAPGTVSTADNTQQYNVSPDIAQTFQKFRGGSYTGPTELQNSQQLQASGQQLSGLGQQFGNQAGRFGLLRQTIAKGPYMQGQQRLDDALLSSRRQQVQPTIQQGMVAGQGIQQGVNAAQQYGQELTGKAAQFGAETNKELQDTASGNVGYLQNVAKQAETEKAARLKSLQDQIASGTGDVTLDAATAKMLGISGGEDAWDAGNAGILNASDTKADIGNVASAADYSRMKALEQLGGANTQGYLSGQGFNTASPDQARSFYQNQLSYDKARAAAEAGNRQQNFMNEQGGNLQGLIDTVRDYQFQKNGPATPWQMLTGTADQGAGLLQNAKNRIAQIQATAAQQGINWNGNQVLSDLQNRDLTDTPYYQGVRQNAINEFLKNNYSSAARKFKIAPETPPEGGETPA